MNSESSREIDAAQAMIYNGVVTDGARTAIIHAMRARRKFLKDLSKR